MATTKLLVLGASGGTGREVVAQALRQGREVTAFVRDPGRIPVTGERLRVVTGDVTADHPALADAVRGQDAVISALGRGNSLKSGGLIGRSAPLVVGAMQRAGVRRLVFTSAYGVGDTWRDVPAVPRLVMRLFMRDLASDKQAGEVAITASDLDWTLVYPVTLTNGPLTGRTRSGERLAMSGFPRISRADVAAFLLAQLDDRSYVRKHVLISG